MNTRLNYKWPIAGLIIAIASFLLVRFCFFSKTEFIVLTQMTETDAGKNAIKEYILVKNPPGEPEELKKRIADFNSKRNPGYRNIDQLFLKEHDYILFPALTLSENYKYENPETNTDKLDNKDFLAKRDRHPDRNGNVSDTLYCFTGRYNYYKK